MLDVFAFQPFIDVPVGLGELGFDSEIESGIDKHVYRDRVRENGFVCIEFELLLQFDRIKKRGIYGDCFRKFASSVLYLFSRIVS